MNRYHDSLILHELHGVVYEDYLNVQEMYDDLEMQVDDNLFVVLRVREPETAVYMLSAIDPIIIADRFIELSNTTSGNGDMLKAVYDPLNINGDAFDMDNMSEGASTKILTDTERSKLSGIESGAEVNQTDSEIKTQYENNSNTNAYTDSEKSKLSGLDSSKFLGEFVSLLALETAHPSPIVGSYANVDLGVGQDVVRYIWDTDDSIYVLQLGVSTVLTDAQIKTQYENNPDTNAYTDAEKSKLSGVEALAEVNNISDANATDLTDSGESVLHYHASDRDRSNHTGSQSASTISDFDTEVSNNTAVSANTAKNSYPTADATKLSGIEALAEVNQTNSEIKTQYELNTNTNAFTDAEKTNLSNQSGTNSGDMSDAQVKTAYENNADTNEFSDAEKINLGNQSGTNTGDQDLSPFATKTQINNTTGYANYLDSSTSVSPRVYAIDTELPLINDKTTPDGSRYPNGVTSYWDSTDKKFTPDQVDGNYDFSVNFIVDPSVRDKTLVVKFISYDAGGVGVDVLIQERLVRLQKDAGKITPVSLSFTTGITSGIIAQGVSVTLEFQGTAADVYSITCGLTKVGASII